MHIPIWLLAIAGVIGFIFLTPYRKGLIDIFSVIWDLVCGSAGRLWDFIRGVAPAAGATAPILGYVGMALMFIALAVILFVAFLYFIIGASITTVGIVIGHWQAALLLLLALSIWGMLSVFPSFLFFKPLVWASQWIARPIAITLFVYLAITSIWWVFGNISPRLQGSLSRSGENKIEETANKIDKGSMKSETEMGKFAKIIEDSQIYNQASQPTFSVQKGMIVMIKDLNGKKADAESEGMTKVMCPDRLGDYQKGNEGWIPTRKLDWDWQSKPTLKSPEINPSANVPAASASSAKNLTADVASHIGTRFKLCFQKREGHAGTNPSKSSGCVDVISLTMGTDSVLFRAKTDGGGEVVYAGNKIQDNEFQGTWTQIHSGRKGEWNMKFSPDLKHNVGWETNNGDTTRIDSWMFIEG